MNISYIKIGDGGHIDCLRIDTIEIADPNVNSAWVCIDDCSVNKINATGNPHICLHGNTHVHLINTATRVHLHIYGENVKLCSQVVKNPNVIITKESCNNDAPTQE